MCVHTAHRVCTIRTPGPPGLVFIVQCMRCPGDCNKMFRIAIAWAQLSTGMGFHLLQHPDQLVPHLECQWFESIRTGLNAIDGSIECTESFLVPPAREGDTHIMDAVCDCKRYTATEIKHINACRLYLQVLLLSDVATPCAQYTIKTYHKGKSANRPNQPTIS